MQESILVLGAGRSSVSLLNYLDRYLRSIGGTFTVADGDESNLRLRTSGLPQSRAVLASPQTEADVMALIQGHRLVISLLPPALHPMVARACLEKKVHLVTASYESDEMRQMGHLVKEAGLIFLNECGLDPGIDHMSAMEVLDDIRGKGGRVLGFESYCGGLVADECDSNPFRYKISWNPRNVVNAGKGVARYREAGRIAHLPYSRLFAEASSIRVPGWGDFEAYPNRDSVSYAAVYGLEGVPLLKRGTLRKPGFCGRWNVLVQAGLTDSETPLVFGEGACYGDVLASFFPQIKPEIYAAFRDFAGSAEWAEDILNLGFRLETPVPLARKEGTAADFLLDRMVEAWALQPDDRDLVVMYHRFEFELDQKGWQTEASFGLKGDNSVQTAMAQTVGLPLGMAARRILEGKISQKGLVLPLHSEIYKPILEELSGFGVQFQLTTTPL